jgi:hypothetical protein
MPTVYEHVPLMCLALREAMSAECVVLVLICVALPAAMSAKSILKSCWCALPYLWHGMPRMYDDVPLILMCLDLPDAMFACWCLCVCALLPPALPCLMQCVPTMYDHVPLICLPLPSAVFAKFMTTWRRHVV